MFFAANPLLFLGLSLLVALAAATAFRLRRRRRLANWFGWAALGGAALALALVAGGIFRRRAEQVHGLQPTLADSASVRARLARGGALIGEYVAKRHAGQTVGVVLSPDDERGDGEEAMLNALTDAIGAACELRVVALPTSGGQRAVERLWHPAKDYDETFAGLADCAAIVSLAGLPANLAEMRFWWSDAPPPLIVANAQAILLRRLVASGRIEALLIRRPWQPGEKEPTTDQEWLLATPQNIAEISRRHPSLFVGD